ncbi:MAG: menaquinol oxidoreductase [Deltaproteobacteria bacterium]|nr:menaquinol oxidoreductase [Deltaproteobacteria bacterium]
MKALYSLFLVFALAAFALVGAGALGMEKAFGLYIPFLAVAFFVVGFCMRVVDWGKSAVPFCIPTTCGQQESLPWIKQSTIENPSTTGGVVIRMILEILLFRSLFRNTKMDFHEGTRVTYSSSKWLWLGALAFHYTFLVTVLRHMRFFTEPIPGFIAAIEYVDSMLQIGAPTLYLSNIIFVLALIYLFLRRVVVPQVRFISQVQDYFPLFLILGIALTGIFMRYFAKVDVISVKQLAMGLVTFSWVVPEGIGSLFYIHIFLVSVLLIYFPLSKLMHMGGVFLSPTRNMNCASRKYRHVNPWKFENVHYHTYDEYEDEYREKMVEKGIPVDKPLEEGAK